MRAQVIIEQQASAEINYQAFQKESWWSWWAAMWTPRSTGSVAGTGPGATIALVNGPISRVILLQVQPRSTVTIVPTMTATCAAQAAPALELEPEVLHTSIWQMYQTAEPSLYTSNFMELLDRMSLLGSSSNEP